MKKGAEWVVPAFSAVLLNLLLFVAFTLFSLAPVLRPQLSLIPVSLHLLPLPQKVAPKKPVVQKKKAPAPLKEKVLGLSQKEVVPTVEPTKMPKTVLDDAAPPTLSPPLFLPMNQLTQPPRFSRQVRPAYPPSERFRGRQSRVVVDVRLRADGSLFAIDVVESGGSAFDKAVMDALRQSVFSPGFLHDKATPTLLRIPFDFKLR